jgi:hypothetical protein
MSSVCGAIGIWVFVINQILVCSILPTVLISYKNYFAYVEKYFLAETGKNSHSAIFKSHMGKIVLFSSHDEQVHGFLLSQNKI